MAVPEEIAVHVARLEKLESELAPEVNENVRKEISRLRKEIEDLDIEFDVQGSGSSYDPDWAKRVVEVSREVRARLSKLERSHGAGLEKSRLLEEAESTVLATEEVVNQFGSALEKKEVAMLRRDLETSSAKGDDRTFRRTIDSLESLRWRALFKQEWFWREIFELLRQPGRKFLNYAEANRWLAHGEEALSRGDSDQLQEAVRHLWELQPKSEAEADRERALRSGIRRF